MSAKVVLAIALIALRGASATVVGAWVLPHGDIALNPDGFVGNASQVHDAYALNRCSLAAGEEIAKSKPDIVLIDSPHGISVGDMLSVYLNPAGEGDVLTEGEPPGRFNLTVEFAPDVAADIVSALSHLNVTGMTAYASGETFPLRWGEIVPLNFLRRSTSQGSKYVIASQPTRRITDPVGLIPGMQAIGRELWRILEKRQERIAVVISADLAHTHDPNGPYGYSTAAQPFDDACRKWASELDSVALTRAAASFAPNALSCGFTGMVMLDAMIAQSHLKWNPSLCHIAHPSYYGMMVASFAR